MHPVPAQHPRQVMQTIPWKYQPLPKELLLHSQMAGGDVHPELSAHFSSTVSLPGRGWIVTHSSGIPSAPPKSLWKPLGHTQPHASTFHLDKHAGLTQSHSKLGNIINGVSGWLTASHTSCFPFHLSTLPHFLAPALVQVAHGPLHSGSHPAQYGFFSSCPFEELEMNCRIPLLSRFLCYWERILCHESPHLIPHNILFNITFPVRRAPLLFYLSS